VIYSLASLTAPPVYQQTLHKLVTGHYLKASVLLSHQSPRDKIIKYDEEERRKISGIPTGRQLMESKATADARLRREEREAEKIGIVSNFLDVGWNNNGTQGGLDPQNRRRGQDQVYEGAKRTIFDC
jgi:hypothetical protein